MLGIDTGGTFTDAVLIDEASSEASVIASAKAPTTHHDLAIGVGAAVSNVLGATGGAAPGDIALVSVSTTLATNALVEGHGEPAGLFTFGFSAADLARIGLNTAVPAELLVQFDGGHDAHGNARVELDSAAIETAAQDMASQVSAFAVAAQFSVRNPSHELAAAEIIRAASGRPVTTSHELSAKLDGPRRALTAALNARLLGTIDRLNRAVHAVLAEQSIDAPLMVVRGDGSLVSAEFAGQRPIETVLSGPAASVIGALHLAGLHDGVVVDIGGTTSDAAVIADGRPSITDGGAVVGAHRTMVEAVEMKTVGLGGDSEVRIDTRDSSGPVLLGPERAIPISRLAVEHPDIHRVLDQQLAAPMGLTTHGRFLVSIAPAEVALADAREVEVLARLQQGPLTPADAAPTGLDARAARRLQARGLVRLATMTPTDARAIVGHVDGVDAVAASKVADILARQTGPGGGVIAASGTELAATVVDRLIHQSAEFVLRTALGSDEISEAGGDDLIAASLNRRGGATRTAISLTSPLTAIGAPAAAYYPAIAALVGTEAIVPDFAEVANAVGAVVGRVRVRQSATVTQPTRGQYRVHLDDQPTFGSVENALNRAREMLQVATLAEAEEAGAATPELTETWDQKVAVIEGKEVFVEGTLTVEASGRPRL